MRKKILAVGFGFLLLFTTYISIFSLGLKDIQEFKAVPLPYSYNALEPFISKEIMTYHHDKHYQTYVANLNKALANYPKYQSYSLEKLLKNLDSLPKEIYKPVKNNAGGVYNHEFFFSVMTPSKTAPSGELKKAIERDFGTYNNFMDEFKKAASSVFGSGWAWLVSDDDGKLSVITTANQDSPISDNLTPIICIDLWEHAYYLQYKNNRAYYIDNWVNVINWKKALENYNNVKK